MLNKSAVSISVALLALCGSAPWIFAQQNPNAPAAAVKTQGNEVVLPVTVRDKHGAMVPNLQASDFTLMDEGKPQTIKSLAPETNAPFRIGLLVDTSRSVSGGLAGERKAAGDFVDHMLPDSEGKDQAFLIHFDREVELLEDFTSSREKLHGELDDMGPTKQERYDQNRGPETTGDDRPRPSSHNGTQLYDAIFLASDELMKGKDGRKALVVFSNGVDRGSKDTLNDAVDAADRANLAVFTIYFKGEEERPNFGSPGSGGRRGGGWPGGGGGGYPGGGYPGGGGGRRGGSSDTGVDGKKIMQQIATRTGGHAFEAKKREDLEAIYKLIEEELRNQYLLTFTPDKADKNGEFHKIVLTAKKNDLTVSTREGYYAPGGDSSR